MLREVYEMNDPIENCSIDDWYQCQQKPCRYHGTCHAEAMLQPEPDTEDDYSMPDILSYESTGIQRKG